MNLSLLLEELLLELSPAEIYDKFYKNINYRAYRAIISSDPQTIKGDGTPAYGNTKGDIARVGKYSKVLLNLFSKGQLKLEDLGKVHEYLTYAYKYHIPLDINKIQSLSDIYNSVKKYMNVDTQNLGVIMNSLSSDDYTTLHDGKKWLILQPLNEKSACYLGVGTQWCTTYGPYSMTKHYQDRENRYNTYNKQGPLYIIINKQDNEEKYQFHFETEQFMDSADRQIKTGKLFHNNPEIRNYFFPSFIKKVTETEIQKEFNKLNMLSQEDALEIIQKVSGNAGKNPLVVAILSKNQERVNILIDDENDLKHSVFVDDHEIEFELKHLNDELNAVDDALRQLSHDKDNSWDQIYSDQQENFDSNEEWGQALEPIFAAYFSGNTYDAQYELGTPTYQNFYDSYFQMFMEDDSIQNEYLEAITRKSYESYENDVQEEIDGIKKYIIIDKDVVYVKTIQFINFLTKNNITHIKNNLVTILNQYIDESHIPGVGEFDHYYGYETEYPTYKDMESAVDRFFNNLMSDMENTKQCLEYRELFNDIFTRIFKNNTEYENDHVYIKILDTRINCADGTVSIIYKNKDKKKEYKGNVKVKNLPVYATNYELFESYIKFKKITLYEQVELNELQGVSSDARIWNGIIRNHIKLGKNSPTITIDGHSYPKEYKVFPVDQFNISVKPEFNDGAAYDENKSGYDENKKYHVYLVMGPYANDSSINHELRHSYEDFMRMSKGNPGLSKSKEGILLFSGDFERFMTSPSSREYLTPISTLLEGLYYTSKIERSAFSDSVYDAPSTTRIIEKITILMKYCNASDILNKIPPETLEKKWKQYKESFHIPISDKFNNYEDFIRWGCDEIQYKGNKTLKKLRNVQYHSQQIKKEESK